MPVVSVCTEYVRSSSTMNEVFAAKEVTSMAAPGSSENRARRRPVNEFANADAVNSSICVMLKVKKLLESKCRIEDDFGVYKNVVLVHLAF